MISGRNDLLVDMAASNSNLQLEEIKRILDLAGALRDDIDPVQEELNHEQLRLAYRDRLIAACSITGDTITEAQADAAVDQYFENMHDFREPSGLSASLAKCYVWLMTLGKPK